MAGTTVIVVAAIGVVINTFTALLFIRGHADANVRGAFLHMAADAAVSAGVSPFHPSESIVHITVYP